MSAKPANARIPLSDREPADHIRLLKARIGRYLTDTRRPGADPARLAIRRAMIEAMIREWFERIDAIHAAQRAGRVA